MPGAATIPSGMSALVDGANLLGIPLSAAQLARFDQYGAALREASEHVNLTSIRDPGEIETRHFLDSLTVALPLLGRLSRGESLRLVDIGAGGGLPGLALKIAFPAIRVTLIESVGKKAALLSEFVEELGLTEVDVLATRSEAAAREADRRDAYDVATARALGSLPVVLELCAPFLAPGGLLVAPRRGDLDAEILAATPAFRALKLWPRVPVPIALPGLEDGRGLVVAEKYAATPSRFPRRAGMAAKRPLV